jgi:hypothetical protein
LFSPSLGTIDDCPFEELPEDQKFEELSYDLLEAVLEEIKDSGEKVLFIMDDVVNDMKKEFHLEKLLCKVLMNRRHQCGSGYLLSTCHRRAVPPRYVRAMRVGGGHWCHSTPIIALCEAGAPQEGFPASSLFVEVVPQRVSRWQKSVEFSHERNFTKKAGVI